MADASPGPTMPPRLHSLYDSVLGETLMRARRSAGFSITALATRLSVRPRTILEIEHGIAPVPAAMLEHWCLITGADAAVLLRSAAAQVPTDRHGVWVDLQTLAELRKRPGGRERLARWAAHRLAAQGSPRCFVRSRELGELADHLDMPVDELIRALHDFTPLAVDTGHRPPSRKYA